MSTTYVIGAGATQTVEDPFGFKPPLANNLLQLALNHPEITDRGTDPYWEAFWYVERFWKLDKESLRVKSFDLEECYSILQLQIAESKRRDTHDTLSKLIIINHKLTALFVHYLNLFVNTVPMANLFMDLSKRMLDEDATVISFNYDTLFEEALEHITRDGSYKHWLRHNHYSIRLRRIIRDPDGSPRILETPEIINQSKKSNLNFLKLHGSVNWWSPWLLPNSDDESKLNLKEGEILLHHPNVEITSLQGALTERISGYTLLPVIVTPVINKEVWKRPQMDDLWRKARNVLAQTETLVIIGYSFPPTDVHVKRLFLEAFAKERPRKVVVIDPNERVAHIVRALSQTKCDPLRYNGIPEYLEGRAET